MSRVTKAELKDAVDLLAEAGNYAALRRELMELIATKETMPRMFAGWLEPLNALIRLEAQSDEAFDGVLELVEGRRKTAPETSKVDYQRDYMRQRRARLNTAVQLEELERGSRLSPAARTTFKRVTMKRWMKARDAFIASRGELDWKQRNEVTGEFWEQLDTQLEHNLIDAKLAQTKQATRRKR
jgi:hypothetical protein